jgi:hypothetical protein
MLAPLAGLVIGFSRDFSIQKSAGIEYNLMRQMLDVSDENIAFVRERAWEAQMVFRALSQRLDEIVGWYEETSTYARQLRNTA